MSQPQLDLGDIGVMFQGIGRGRGPEPVHAEAVDVDPCRLSPLRNDRVNPVRANAGAGGGATDRAEQRAIPGFAFIVPLQVLVDPLGGHRVQR